MGLELAVAATGVAFVMTLDDWHCLRMTFFGYNLNFPLQRIP